MLRTIFRPYTEEQYHARQTLIFILMPLGLVSFVAARYFATPIGLLTAVAVVFAGAAFGCYLRRSTEHGLWMLALFVGVCLFAFYALAIAMEIRDWFQRRTPTPLWLYADLSIAGLVCTVAARASWTVFLQNRRLSAREKG